MRYSSPSSLHTNQASMGWGIKEQDKKIEDGTLYLLFIGFLPYLASTLLKKLLSYVTTSKKNDLGCFRVHLSFESYGNHVYIDILGPGFTFH
jgi:hypothetical protein